MIAFNIGTALIAVVLMMMSSTLLQLVVITVTAVILIASGIFWDLKSESIASYILDRGIL